MKSTARNGVQARVSLALILLGLLMLIPFAADAADPPPPPARGFNAGFIDATSCATLGFAQCAADALRSGLLGLIGLALGFMSIVALIAVITGGVMYVISVGNDDKTAQAKKVILYSIIGLIVLGLSMAAVNLVINVIN